jgi:hypothetical protein
MLARLVSTIALSALKDDVSAIAGRAGKRAAFHAVAAVLWLTAFGFLVAALAVWLNRVVDPILAYAILAAGLAVATLLVHLGLALSARRRPRSDLGAMLAGLAAPAGSSSGAAAGAGGDIGALAVVAVIGWLLGRGMTK